MRKTILLLALIAIGLSAVYAKMPKKRPIEPMVSESVKPVRSTPAIGSEPPRAVVYSMNGAYSGYVPVTLSDDRKALVSFPAPSDINEDQKPVNVGDGLWLDRRGVSRNTAFTKWTYEEYEALETTPTPDEILSNLIPEARVTEIISLPMFAGEAAQNPTAVRRTISDGLKNATIIWRAPGAGKRIDYGEPGPSPVLMTGEKPASQLRGKIIERHPMKLNRDTVCK